MKTVYLGRDNVFVLGHDINDVPTPWAQFSKLVLILIDGNTVWRVDSQAASSAFNTDVDGELTISLGLLASKPEEGCYNIELVGVRSNGNETQLIHTSDEQQVTVRTAVPISGD